MKHLFAALALCAAFAASSQEQKPISQSAVRGMSDSYLGSVNAVAKECAERNASLLEQATDTITKQAKEIEALKEKLKPKPEEVRPEATKDSK